MHFLDLHINDSNVSDNIFSDISRLLYKNKYGVIFWMIEEKSRIDIGLVVKLETKPELKEKVSVNLTQNGIDNFEYSQPRNPQVPELWMQ